MNIKKTVSIQESFLSFHIVLFMSYFLFEGDIRGPNPVKLKQAPTIAACFQAKCHLQVEARSEEHYRTPNIVVFFYSSRRT